MFGKSRDIAGRIGKIWCCKNAPRRMPHGDTNEHTCSGLLGRKFSKPAMHMHSSSPTLIFYRCLSLRCHAYTYGVDSLCVYMYAICGDLASPSQHRLEVSGTRLSDTNTQREPMKAPQPIKRLTLNLHGLAGGIILPAPSA